MVVNLQILSLSKEHIWSRSIQQQHIRKKRPSNHVFNKKWKLEHPKYNKADAYNQLERHEQVVIFRLRTNHNKLKQHLYRTFKVGDTDQCPCGEEAQIAEHILQLYKELRVRTWPQPTLEAQKLYGCLTDLQRTGAFISETGLTI